MLTGDTVALREAADEDIPFLQALRNSVDLQAELMALPRPSGRARVKEWLQGRTTDAKAVFFVIAERESNQAKGFIQLLNIDLLHGHGDLGICVSPAAQHQGMGREALALLEGYVQRFFRLRKIMLEVLNTNTTAISFYVKSGYRRVGVLRKHFYQDGTYRDVIVMEKLLSKRRVAI